VNWYIPANLTAWGVEVPTSWDEFLAIAPTLEAQGIVPLALAQNWTVNHLWESVAVAVLGADKYAQLWDGTLAFNSADGIAVWEMLDRILVYTNADASSLSWQQATDMVVNGQAAFNIMGDWAAGYLTTTLGLTPNVDYGWAASPGTDGIFIALSDSFGLPKGAPNRDNCLAWLRLLGSQDGQDAFNPLKGSIAARVDSDLTKYNVYGQSAAADWKSDTIAGSLAHGFAANEGFMNDFATVMEIFLAGRDPVQAANAAAAIAAQNGI